MDLSNVSTKKLVEELESRQAVEKIAVEPYEEYSITVGNKKNQRRRTCCYIENLGLNNI